MDNIRFRWDAIKNQANIKNHKISIEGSKSVFVYENARVIPDPEYSKGEKRFIILGLSIKFRLIIVIHPCK